MPPFTEPQPPTPVSRGEAAGWLGLIALLVLSRVAVAPTDLLEWDSANYALSITDYNVFEHRPHGPGYPLFSLALGALAAFLPTWLAFVALNAALGAGTLVALAWMARPALGPRGAWLLGAAMVACPIFWLHGAASTAYVAEAFCAVATGALGIGVLRGQIRLEVAAVGWALCLGLRPNGALTLSPVMVLVAWWHSRTRGLGPSLRALAAGAVTCLGWWSVMVAESGGVAAWSSATSALSEWQFKAGSALADGRAVAIRNGTSLATYLLDALNLGVLALLVPLMAGRLERPHFRTTIFFTVWMLPPATFYVVHHLPKSGYALTIVPVAALALALAGRSMPRVAASVASGYALVNGILFFLATPRGAVEFGDAPELVPDTVYVYGDYSAAGLQYLTRPQRALAAELDAADPERDAVLFLSGAHELHRLAMATHGEFPLLASFVERGWIWSTRDEETYGAWQVRVLRAPRIHSTDLFVSEVDWDGEHLTLTRLSHTARRELRAERLLVVIPCAPCVVSNEGPSVASRRVELGAGFVATWFEASQPLGKGLP